MKDGLEGRETGEKNCRREFKTAVLLCICIQKKNPQELHFVLTRIFFLNQKSYFPDRRGG